MIQNIHLRQAYRLVLVHLFVTLMLPFLLTPRPHSYLGSALAIVASKLSSPLPTQHILFSYLGLIC